MLIESAMGLGVGCALGLGLHVSPYPQKLSQVRQLQGNCVANRWFSLTFDDGPGPELTPVVLDLLDTHQVKATFFLLGRRVLESPEVVDEIQRRGHEIGCHSMNHYNSWKSSPWTANQDVRDGYHAIQKWIPNGALYRPPHGKLSFSVWRMLRQRGSDVGWWTIDSGDTFKSLPAPHLAGEGLKREGGGVVLLHDFDRKDPQRRDFVLDATRFVLETAEKEGLSPKLLGDILRSGNNHR